MAITKVWIEEDTCTGYGICEDTCPEVFLENLQRGRLRGSRNRGKLS